jgi:uncharacterized phage-associated protein/TPR repeat protein
MLDKKEVGVFPHMDKLKLHKLCYYAQGYYLAFLNRRLFDEPTYAYTFGPFYGDTVKTVYPECTIGHKGTLALKRDINLGDRDPRIIQFLRWIYEMKKASTGIDLKNASHKEVPWNVTYKDGVWNIISRDVLRDFFSAAAQIAPFIKKSLEGTSLDQFLDQTFRTKQLLRRIHNIKEIISFNDDLLDTLSVRPIIREELENVSSHVTELIDWKQENPRNAVAGFLFFPSELIEDYTPLAILFLNLPLHWKLAYSARYGHPVAQLFFAKLLEHFEVLTDKRDLFLERSKSQFERIASDATLQACTRGLAFKYLDREEEARTLFQEGDTLGDFFSTHELAKIMDRRGEEGVFDVYKRSFEGGYALAELGMGYYADTDIDRFESFKHLGEAGIGEGYYQIGKMIKEGFDVPEGNPAGSRYWFSKAAEAGSVTALLTLAKDSEEENKDKKAMKYYEAFSKTGNLSGFLEHGRILENNGLYEEAKEIYENAGWMGLYEIARLMPAKEEEIKAQARRQFEKHFNDLVDIAEGKDDIEE